MNNLLENLSEQPSCSIFDASNSTAKLLEEDKRLIKFNKSFFTKNLVEINMAHNILVVMSLPRAAEN